MSKNQFLEFLVYISPIFLGAILLAVPQEKEVKREPQSLIARPIVQYPSANINYEKIEKLVRNQVYDSAVMKVKGHLQVRLELLDDYEEEQPFRLKAYITSTQDVEYADVRWALGPGVEMLSGVQENVVYNLNPTEPVVDEITVQKTKDGLPARVFFNVKYEKHGKVFAQTGYYSSQHQQQVETEKSKKLLNNSRHLQGGLKVIY